MQSKISFFNKTIFKKNLTRFWPFAVLYGLYLILAHPLVLHAMLHDMGELNASLWRDTVANHFANVTEPFSVFIAAIVVAMAVFGYLYQSRSANMLHTFPVTRSELFVTNYISGLVLMLIPQLVAAFGMNFVILGKANELIWAVWAWLGITVGETIFFFGFACFVAMFTGQLMAAPLFYMIWNFLYFAVVGLINAMAELLVFGISGSLLHAGNHPLLPVTWLYAWIGFSDDKVLEPCGIFMLAIYVVAGLLFAAAAFYVYQKRRLECAGDFLTVGWTKPLFRWGTAVIGGVAGAICLTYLFGGGYGSYSSRAGIFVILLVLVGAVLFFVAEMFIEKSFRVFKKKIAVECVSCVAVLLVGVALLQFDVFGYETYVPEVSAVDSVTLSGYGSASFDSEEDIEKVRAMHQLLLSRKDELKKNQNDFVSDDEMCMYIRIEYQMKNGETVSRAYDLQSTDTAFMEELQEQCYSLISDPEAVKRSYFGMNYEELDWEVTSASLEYASQSESGAWLMNPIYGTQSELQKLYDAVLLDMEAGAFCEYDAYGFDDYEVLTVGTGDIDALITLDIWTQMNEKDIRYASYHPLYRIDSGKAVGTNMRCEIYLNNRCTHTIDTLIEYGWLESVEELAVQ